MILIWIFISSSLVSFALGRMFARNRAVENYEAATLAYRKLCDAKDHVIASQKEKAIALEELRDSQVELLEIQENLIQALSGERDSLKELNQRQLELDEAQKNLIKSLSEGLARQEST